MSTYYAPGTKLARGSRLKARPWARGGRLAWTWRRRVGEAEAWRSPQQRPGALDVFSGKAQVSDWKTGGQASSQPGGPGGRAVWLGEGCGRTAGARRPPWGSWAACSSAALHNHLGASQPSAWACPGWMRPGRWVPQRMSKLPRGRGHTALLDKFGLRVGRAHLGGYSEMPPGGATSRARRHLTGAEGGREDGGRLARQAWGLGPAGAARAGGRWSRRGEGAPGGPGDGRR